MKRTTLSLLIVAMFSGFGASAQAGDTSVGTPGNDNARITTAPADKGAVKDPSGTSHRDARAKCDSLKGDAMRACQTDADTSGLQSTADAPAPLQEAGAMQVAATEDGQSKSQDPVPTDTMKAPAADAAPAPAAAADGDALRTYRESGATLKKPGAIAAQPTTGKPDDGARSTEKGTESAARVQAQTQYMDAKAICDTQEGEARRACMTEATTARTAALAKAKTPGTVEDKATGSDADAVKRAPGTTGMNEPAQPAAAVTPAKAGGNSQQVGGSPDNDPAAQKPGATSQPKRAAQADAGDASRAKADYSAARDKAQTDYQDAKAKCGDLQGSAAGECMTTAKVVLADALALAKTQRDERRATKTNRAPADGNKTEADPSTRGGSDNTSPQRKNSQ